MSKRNRVTVLKDHCEGCVWGRTMNDGVVFCPFVRCVKRYGFTTKNGG